MKKSATVEKKYPQLFIRQRMERSVVQVIILDISSMLGEIGIKETNE